ncbi:MAG: hypothetical protein ACXWP5_14610 [Bdellovibrionota bacterium]
MKTLLISTLAVLFVISPASAAQKEHSATHYASPSSDEESSLKWGLGLATPHPCSVLTPAITGMIDIGAGNVVQMFFGVGGTSPFSMGAGGAFKHTILGHDNLGLHVGGGFGLGALPGGLGSVFAADIAGLAGFHAELPGLAHIQFQFDAGPQFLVTSGGIAATGAGFNFSLGPVSAALGLSVLYIF